MILLLLRLKLTKHFAALFLEFALFLILPPMIETSFLNALLVLIGTRTIRADHILAMEGKQELLILIVVHLVIHLALHGALYQLDDVQVLMQLLFASLVDLVVLIRLHELVCALFELAAEA